MNFLVSLVKDFIFIFISTSESCEILETYDNGFILDDFVYMH